MAASPFGNVAVALDKTSYSAGEAVHARVSLELPRPTKVRGVYAVLTCSERKKEQVTRMMTPDEQQRRQDLGVPYSTDLKTEIREHSSNWFFQEKKIAGEQILYKAELSASFQLPHNAMPTSLEFGHDNAIHIWRLTVRVDIPLALDMNASAEVHVEGLGR